MKTKITGRKCIAFMIAVMVACACLAVPAFAEPAEAEGSVPVDPMTGWGQYDSLIEQIRSTSDPAARSDLMHQAEDMLMATWCVLPVNYFVNGYLLQEDVTGVYNSPNGMMYTMYAEFADGADTLTSCLGISGMLYSIDPLSAVSPTDMTVTAALFSGLYAFDADGRAVPACAEDFPVTEDGATYTVTLKEGLKWSDGTDLTAGDFVYSWQRVINGWADYSYLFSLVYGDPYAEPTDLQVTAVDERTLTFAAPGGRSAAYIAELLSWPVFYPVQQAYVEANSSPDDPSAWAAVPGFPTNGAYTLTEWSDDILTLTANPYWYDADRVAAATQIFKFNLPDSAMILLAFEEGSLDFVDLSAFDEAGGLALLRENQDPRLHAQAAQGTQYLCFNCRSALFADKSVEQAAAMRQAFSILLNRQAWCEENGNGMQIPASSLISPSMSDGCGNPYAGGEYYDPYLINNDPEGALQQARALLESAGYVFGEDGLLSPETPISFDFSIRGGQENFADRVATSLAKLGIGLEILPYDWEAWSGIQDSGNYTLARGAWICDTSDPLEMLENMTSNSVSNICRFGTE